VGGNLTSRRKNNNRSDPQGEKGPRRKLFLAENLNALLREKELIIFPGCARRRKGGDNEIRKDRSTAAQGKKRQSHDRVVRSYVNRILRPPAKKEIEGDGEGSVFGGGIVHSGEKGKIGERRGTRISSPCHRKAASPGGGKSAC